MRGNNNSTPPCAAFPETFQRERHTLSQQPDELLYLYLNKVSFLNQTMFHVEWTSAYWCFDVEMHESKDVIL